jgi:hypothetical protein
MKKAFIVGLALVILSPLPAAQSRKRPAPRFVLSFGGGPVWPQTGESTRYADIWAAPVSGEVRESTEIGFTAKRATAFSGSVTYFIKSTVGIQFAAGAYTSSLPNTAEMTLEPNQENGGWQALHAGFAGEGKISSIPLSLNIALLVPVSRFDLLISTGLTVYANSAQASSAAWWGNFRFDPSESVELIDVARVDIHIPKTSWVGIGMNLGLGLSYTLVGKLAAFAEARYYLCPPTDLSWQWPSGTYSGVFGKITDMTISPDDAARAAALTGSHFINPSFFAASAGVRLAL